MSRIYGVPWAQVPEWLLDAEVSDRAVRLFAVLNRHADANGRAYPGRPKLAERLRCGVSSLDRAMDELVTCDAVVVEPHYRSDGSRAANSYWVWPAHPLVNRGLPTGDGTPPPPVTPPLPASRAAEGNESHVEREPMEPTPDLSLDVQVSPTSAQALAGFDAFWSAYPRKTAKGTARTAWVKALRKVPDPTVIVDGARRFADDPNRADEFTPHAATWLNGERWDDPPLPTRGKPNGKGPTHRPIMDDRSVASGRIEL